MVVPTPARTRRIRQAADDLVPEAITFLGGMLFKIFESSEWQWLPKRLVALLFSHQVSTVDALAPCRAVAGLGRGGMGLGSVLFALLQTVVFGRPVLVGRSFHLALLRRLLLPLLLPLPLLLLLLD